MSLTPGETRRVTMHVMLDDLRWWNPAMRAWSMEAGNYRAMVGAKAATFTL